MGRAGERVAPQLGLERQPADRADPFQAGIGSAQLAVSPLGAGTAQVLADFRAVPGKGTLHPWLLLAKLTADAHRVTPLQCGFKQPAGKA
jgi:hypothetical protein